MNKSLVACLALFVSLPRPTCWIRVRIGLPSVQQAEGQLTTATAMMRKMEIRLSLEEAEAELRELA